jgi:hypothetical protein
LRCLNKRNSVEEPKPPWSLLSPTVSMVTISFHWELNLFVVAASHGSKSYGYLDFDKKMKGYQIVTEGATYFDLQHFEWSIPWYFYSHHAVSSCNWPRLQPVGGHWTSFFFCSDIFFRV